MEKNNKNYVVDSFVVPIEVPPDGIEVQEKPPVITVTGDTLEPIINKLEEVETGFVLYKITQPNIPHRFVLVNTALGNTPAFMSIVSGRYRVLRPTVALKMIKEAVEEIRADEEFSIVGTISKQVLVTLAGKTSNGVDSIVYINSFDRSVRETVILPGLRAVRYTHTNNGKNKDDMAHLVELAFNQEDIKKWREALLTVKLTKATFNRFIKVNLSTTPRTLLLKFFKYADPISDYTEADFREAAYREYVNTYGDNLVGFVDFIHKYYKEKVSQGNLSRAVSAIQAGASLVDSLVHVRAQ